MSPRHRSKLLVASAAVVAIAPAGCDLLVAEPAGDRLPPGDDLPPDVDAMLYGSGQSCREDRACPGGVCYFGSCVGLLIVDQRWMQEAITARVAERAAGRPELRERIVFHLRRVLEREDTDLAYRARAILPLEALGEAALLRPLLGEETPERLQGAAALALARMGDSAALPLARAMTEDDSPAIAAEALRAIGKGKLEGGLDALLRSLVPDLDAAVFAAGLDALADLGDVRAVRPLVDLLPEAPEHFQGRVVRTLRRLTNTSVGREVAAWRRWVVEESPPPAPEFVPRAASPAEELGLPPP